MEKVKSSVCFGLDTTSFSLDDQVVVRSLYHDRELGTVDAITRKGLNIRFTDRTEFIKWYNVHGHAATTEKYNGETYNAWSSQPWRRNSIPSIQFNSLDCKGVTIHDFGQFSIGKIESSISAITIPSVKCSVDSAFTINGVDITPGIIAIPPSWVATKPVPSIRVTVEDIEGNSEDSTWNLTVGDLGGPSHHGIFTNDSLAADPVKINWAETVLKPKE
jgi:hypothetical protein